MNISPLLLLEYQKSLIIAALDYFSPNDLLSNAFGGQFGQSLPLWKEAVIEFLRVNIESGFIEFAKADESLLPVERKEFLCKLAQSNPHENVDVWMGVRFESTQKLNLLVANHGLLSWESLHKELNKDFVGSVFKAYSKFRDG
jgi:hypothetical protein